MRAILLLASVFLLSGCGYFQRLYTHYTGDITTKCAPSGVEYLQSDSGLAVHVDLDGMPIPCTK